MDDRLNIALNRLNKAIHALDQAMTDHFYRFETEKTQFRLEAEKAKSSEAHIRHTAQKILQHLDHVIQRLQVSSKE